MKITILGTGGALSPQGRTQTAICLAKGENQLLVDAGSGLLLRLDQAEIDVRQLNTVLLSHHHLDHMSDLLPLITARWLAGNPHTRIYGPQGTDSLIRKLLELYEYVRSHVELEIVDLENGATFSVAGFHIECLSTVHGTPSLAYKFDGKLVISGDTKPFPEMAQFAQGCQMLIHECSSPDHHELPNHTRPQELGKLLAHCDVKTLLITHLYPSTQGREAEMIASIQENYLGEVFVAEDLAQFEI